MTYTYSFFGKLYFERGIKHSMKLPGTFTNNFFSNSSSCSENSLSLFSPLMTEVGIKVEAGIKVERVV